MILIKCACRDPEASQEQPSGRKKEPSFGRRRRPREADSTIPMGMPGMSGVPIPDQDEDSGEEEEEAIARAAPNSKAAAKKAKVGGYSNHDLQFSSRRNCPCWCIWLCMTP